MKRDGKFYMIKSRRTDERFYVETREAAEASLKYVVEYLNECIDLGIMTERKLSEYDFIITKA